MVTSESTGAHTQTHSDTYTAIDIKYACCVLYFQSRLSVTYRFMPQQPL